MNKTVVIDPRIPFAIGIIVGGLSVLPFLNAQNESFCKFDDKKNDFVERMWAKVSPHLPPEVEAEIRSDAAFLNIALNEGL